MLLFFFLFISKKSKAVLEGCVSWTLGCYCNNPGVSSRNLLEGLYFEGCYHNICSSKSRSHRNPYKHFFLYLDVILKPPCTHIFKFLHCADAFLLHIWFIFLLAECTGPFRIWCHQSLSSISFDLVCSRVSFKTGQCTFLGQRDRSSFIVPGQRDSRTSSKSCRRTEWARTACQNGTWN